MSNANTILNDQINPIPHQNEQLKITVEIQDDVVGLLFNQQVARIGFTPNQAIELGRELIKKGRGMQRSGL